MYYSGYKDPGAPEYEPVTEGRHRVRMAAASGFGMGVVRTLNPVLMFAIGDLRNQ